MNDEQFEIITEILGGLYIQSLRNYDLLMLIADKLGAKVIDITQMHQRGQVLCPDPALSLDDDE